MACLLGFLEEPPWRKQLESPVWGCRPVLQATREVRVCRSQVQGQPGPLSEFKADPSNFLRPHLKIKRKKVAKVQWLRACLRCETLGSVPRTAKGNENQNKYLKRKKKRRKENNNNKNAHGKKLAWRDSQCSGRVEGTLTSVLGSIISPSS